jgi:hypothetical protein
MAVEPGVSYWGAIAVAFGGFAAVAVLRPWRCLRARTSCPQCKEVLPRWDRWGWRQAWTCPRCGCQVGG